MRGSVSRRYATILEVCPSLLEVQLRGASDDSQPDIVADQHLNHFFIEGRLCGLDIGGREDDFSAAAIHEMKQKRRKELFQVFIGKLLTAILNAFHGALLRLGGHI